MGSSPSSPLLPKTIFDIEDPFTAILAVGAIVYVLILILACLLLRLYLILPGRVKYARGAAAVPKGKQQIREKPASIMVVLGSGGHTKEVLTMLQGLDKEKYDPAYFVRAASDTRSDGMVATAVSASKESFEPDETLTIPRSRHVGQSWSTTPFTTAYALLASILLVFRIRPEVIVCNGPGTCLPLCLAGFLLRYLGIKRTKIIFIESFCRVTSLSLTGKLLYYIADRFIVQWPALLNRYKLAEYLGQIC